MEETFNINWGDSAVVQTEEVICGIENEILSNEEELAEVPIDTAEEVVGETTEEIEEAAAEGRIVYLDDGNIVVINDTGDGEELMECQVAEEIITEQWDESCPEEIVVGSEEAVGGSIEEGQEEDIKLPTDEDQLSAIKPYPCDFCSRRFRKKGNLMNHMIAHQTDRPHGCNLCGVRYIRKSDLMNHLKIHAYSPDADGLEEEELSLDEGQMKRKQKQLFKRKKKMERTDDSFEEDPGTSSSHNYSYVEEEVDYMNERSSINKTDEEYQEYMNDDQRVEEEEIRFPVTDPRKPFVCQHCGVGFAREKALLSHTRLHAEGDSPFECQKCGDMFWDANQMRIHAKTKHGETEDLEIDDGDEDYSDEESSYETFYCQICGMGFHRQENLKRHERIHLKTENVNSEFCHVCNVCGESFPEALDLLAHAEVHARTDEYRCMICGEVHLDESALAVHVQAKHGNELPPNSCMLCGRACKDRRGLLKHSWEHSKEKSFTCTKCSKYFHSKARLKRHMLSHRCKVVTCDVCGEEFPDGRSLMNHRHSHNSVSGRQFPCRECGKTFGSRSSQQIHIRIHTGERPYGCRFCWKAFADGGTLRKHERIHTGEKPYACAVCPRAFNQRVVLREHIRSHHSGPDPKYTNSVTPYCCSVCSDMFATSQDLILHLIHHCDMNTAMKRAPQIRPRKYKRRRKLKPHEIEMMSSAMEETNNSNNLELLHEQEMDETYIDSEEDRDRKRNNKKPARKISASERNQSTEGYSDFFSNDSLENVNSTKVTPPKSKQKKVKSDQSVPSRPKMIHTQKTRVPVEAGEDGRVRHKTKTMVTRTQPTELKSATGERIRPRTKNVNYHIFQEKLPLATFPESDRDTQKAVESILKEESHNEAYHDTSEQLSNGPSFMEDIEQPPEVAAEQTVETEEPVPVSMIQIKRTKTRSSSSGGNTGSLKPGRHIIGPGSKVRIIKQGMIVSKAKKTPELESATSEITSETTLPEAASIKLEPINIKHEMVDPSPLHELAEISMQHAQNLFKCEMCSEVFSDRAQLLVHVPIHI